MNRFIEYFELKHEFIRINNHKNFIIIKLALVVEMY